MTKTRKTAKAIATINGSFLGTPGNFLYALSDEGQWYVKVTRKPLRGWQSTGVWTPCDSPLEAFEVTRESLAGDVSFKVGTRPIDAPGIEGWGVAFDVFVCGDIAHRLRLPKV